VVTASGKKGKKKEPEEYVTRRNLGEEGTVIHR
jgi:hypothetical protein